MTELRVAGPVWMPRKRTYDTSSHTRDIAESWAKERPDLDPLDYLLPIYLLRIGRYLERVEDQRWKQTFGLSNAKLRALFALRRGGEQRARRPTDLFRALLVTSGAISKQLSRLEALEFVAREPDPRNAGGFLVRLTPAGNHVADHAMDEFTKSSVLSRRAFR